MDTKRVLEQLRGRGNRATLKGMRRYGIVAKRAFGVPMSSLLKLQKEIGTDHELATALWRSGWYEARLLAALIGDPERVTGREMNAWARSFENWGDCDTVCFKLWDRTPLAWEKARQWSAEPREFVKRAGFVLIACLALHDETAPDGRFRAFLPLIERGAEDQRNFVMKGVSWALRSVGRRTLRLNAAAVKVAKRLAVSKDAGPRWVGRDALRELVNPKLRARLAGKARSASSPRYLPRRERAKP